MFTIDIASITDGFQHLLGTVYAAAYGWFWEQGLHEHSGIQAIPKPSGRSRVHKLISLRRRQLPCRLVAFHAICAGRGETSTPSTPTETKTDGDEQEVDADVEMRLMRMHHRRRDQDRILILILTCDGQSAS
jgi:hypothetical protein